MSAAELLQLAADHIQAGRLDAADHCYRQILHAEPNHVPTLLRLGVLYELRGLPDRAAGCFEQAIARQPGSADAHHSLGILRQRAGRLDEAMAEYQQAIGAQPDFAEAYYNLGNALRDSGRPGEAIAAFQRALELSPGLAPAAMNLGNLWAKLDQPDGALACYQRALQVRPDYAKVYNNLGNVLKDCGQPEAALSQFARATQLQPDFDAAHSNFLYTLLFCPGLDARQIYAEHARWNRDRAAPLAPAGRPPVDDRRPDRPLRVGYVSPDFGDHVVGRNLLPLLRQHDRQHFHIVAYSLVNRSDSLAELFRRHVDVWRDASGLADDALAQLVRDDRIDILVDTTLHMAGNRLLVFARRPAPLQVTFAGYPGTTGLATMDYRLTDPYLDPPNADATAADYQVYSERSVRLPHAFWCYDPLTDRPTVAPLPADRNGQVTFGSLNNFAKINPQVLKLWSRVLAAVPGSRLLLLAAEGSHRTAAVELLAGQGVAPDRVRFAGKRPREQYLELYHELDIALDTLPYNGHTTGLDALWMGVPTVTPVGQTVVGRAGLSQLMNLGLPELIADTPDRFVEIAADLAGDLPRLRELRATLRPRMQASPLMDGPGFARGVEAAYREMWRKLVAAC